MLGYGDEKAGRMDGKIIRAKGVKEINKLKKKLLSPSSLTCHGLML
jgi:hypothetical protein